MWCMTKGSRPALLSLLRKVRGIAYVRTFRVGNAQLEDVRTFRQTDCSLAVCAGI